jgi:hypothetical protein
MHKELITGVVLNTENISQRAWTLMEPQVIEGRVFKLALFEAITCDEIINALIRGAVGAKPILAAVGPLDHTIVSAWAQELWG